MKEINDALDGVEEVISPTRGVRVVWKIVALAVTVMVGLAAVRVTSHFLVRTEDVTDNSITTVVIDRMWFSRRSEEIAAVDAEIAATEQALQRKRDEAKDRWVSRESDRAEFDRLNHRLIDLQRQRAQLIIEFNTNVSVHPELGIAAIGTN